MPKSTKAAHPLIDLLAASGRPIYAVDGERRIVYCNPALEAWLELSADRIVGRLVEYHSESTGGGDAERDTAGPLTGLCPPPNALTGDACAGTVSCVPRDGRLVHRSAEFIPLRIAAAVPDKKLKGEDAPRAASVLVLLASNNLTPAELSLDVSTEPTADDLHRTIRRFRRAQAGRYSLESLLGTSSAIRKVRSQVAAAASSGANVLICGRRGAGHADVARAIHYHAAEGGTHKLVPLDGPTLTDDGLRRALDAVGNPTHEASRRPVLLIEQIERISAHHQSQLIEAIRRGPLAARIIATTCDIARPSDATDATIDDDNDPLHELNAAFRDIVSTITIQLPRLADRPDDLPMLAQFFLEAVNRGNPKQVGSIRPEALDLLALYRWPGELDELRDVIAAAHHAATSHVIAPADLPAIVHHAAKAAALPKRTPEHIVLDELLTTIETEAIVRALAQAGGNKSAAADLVGLTRPRLYRRMVQLGLAPPTPSEAVPKFKEVPLPDFRELEPEEPTA